MLRLVAPVTDHLSVAVVPLVIQVGLAAKLLITGGDPGGGGLEPPPQPDMPSATRTMSNILASVPDKLATAGAATHPCAGWPLRPLTPAVPVMFCVVSTTIPSDLE